MAEKFFGVEDIKVIGLTSTKDLIVSGVSTFQDVNIGTGGTVAFFDVSSGKVGIGSTIPAYTLDLGESPSTIRIVSDDGGTAIRMGAGDQNHDFTMLRVDGSTGQHDGESDDNSFGYSLKYIGSGLGNNNKLGIVADNQAGGTAIDAFTMLQDGSVGINSTNPRATLDVDGTLIVSGVSTLGVTTITDITSQQLFVSGISTLGNVFIEPVGTGASVGEKEPGVSGVVAFYGDGSGLRNVVAIGTGIDVRNNGIAVGSASTINFGDNLTGSLSNGVYTVNAPDIPDVDTTRSSYSDYASHSETANYAYGIVGIGTTSYNQVGILTGTYADDEDDYFGYSVATSTDGNTIIVGAYQDEIPGSLNKTGVVYVYDRVGTTFTQVGIITGNDSSEHFGYSVACSADGENIVIGALYTGDGTTEGAVYVYDRVGTTTSFTQVGILKGTHAVDSFDKFGDYVACSADGSTIIVCAPEDELPGGSTNSGIVYVYDRVGSTFTEVGILTGYYDSSSSSFGISAACSDDGNAIVIGSEQRLSGSSGQSGMVYVFDRQYSGIGATFIPVGILTGSHADDAYDFFGYSVATSTDGNTIIVGAYRDNLPGSADDSGIVYVFDREYSVGIGTTFNQVGILTGSHANDEDDYFGGSVACSADGNIIVVGAYKDELPGSADGSGLTYVFNRQGNNFTEVGILTGSHADDANDYFGRSVACSADGKHIIVGAYQDELPSSGSESGLVYVFDQDVDANSLLSSTDGKNITIDANIIASGIITATGGFNGSVRGSDLTGTIIGNTGLDVTGVSTFRGDVVLSDSSAPDFIMKSSIIVMGTLYETEHFTVKDGNVFIKEDLYVSGICTVGTGISVGVGISIGPDIVETRKSTDIKLNETLYITPDDNVQNWYIPVGYARTTSPQVGTALTQSALAGGTTYTRGTDALVYDYCWDNYEIFDLDGDGIVSPIDAQIFYRYYVSSAFHSASLTNNYDSLFSSNATRTDYTSIIGYIIKYAKQTQTVSFSSGTTTISGITTGTDVPKVRAGIAVTGPGIPADTTVVSIGAGSMTISNPTSGAESSVDLTFGNGLHNIRGGPSIESGGDGLILSRIFGSATVPGSPYTAVHYESYQYNNNEFLNPNDGGPAQFKRYQKVSIADTTSNAGGARYISTEAPSAGIGTEGDIWYDISATGDSAGTNGNIPIGGIIMWYGTIANIPASWALCDGTSYSTAVGTIATPDLRGQFIVGAADDTIEGTFSNNIGVGSTGGSKNAVLIAHSHTASTSAANAISGVLSGGAGGIHDHETGQNDAYDMVSNTVTIGIAGTDTAGNSSNTQTGTDANLPPYYALAYIMRIV